MGYSAFQSNAFQNNAFQIANFGGSPAPAVDAVPEISYPVRKPKALKNPWATGRTVKPEAVKVAPIEQKKVVDISSEVEQLRLLRNEIDLAVQQGKTQAEYLELLRAQIQADSDRVKLIKMLEAEILFRQSQDDEIILLLLMSEV